MGLQHIVEACFKYRSTKCVTNSISISVYSKHYVTDIHCKFQTTLFILQQIYILGFRFPLLCPS